jgi:hypothetical protein
MTKAVAVFRGDAGVSGTVTFTQTADGGPGTELGAIMKIMA